MKARQTRDISKLLRLLLLRMKLKGVHLGMCRECTYLLRESLITPEEHVLMIRYFKDHVPSFAESKDFWWKKGDAEPRINWVKERLSYEKERENS